MGGFFDRGASAGGQEDGYFERESVTGPAGVGSATGGPGGINKDDIVRDSENPNIARAVPQPGDSGATLDETAGVTSLERIDPAYGQIIEGSDSPRTGTSWGLPGIEDAPTVETPRGLVTEGEESGEAHPNRNTGEVTIRDELRDVGSWSTIDTDASAGSSTGNS